MTSNDWRGSLAGSLLFLALLAVIVVPLIGYHRYDRDTTFLVQITSNDGVSYEVPCTRTTSLELFYEDFPGGKDTSYTERPYVFKGTSLPCKERWYSHVSSIEIIKVLKTSTWDNAYH